MSFNFYLEADLDSDSKVDPVDVFAGDGVTTTFTLGNKTATHLHSTIQVSGTQYYQYNGGFTKNTSNDTFTMASAPSAGAVIVAPGMVQIPVPIFDQETVDGVDNPRIKEVLLYVADPDESHLFKYLNMPQYTGIRISLVDLVSGYGGQTSWCQLACTDYNGNALTYAATAADLFLPALWSFGTITASNTAGASSIFVTSASDFIIGQIVNINTGTATRELRRVKEIVSATNKVGFTTNLDFPHYIGEAVFACGWQIALKVTMPVNQANNTATNFLDVALRRQARVESRV